MSNCALQASMSLHYHQRLVQVQEKSGEKYKALTTKGGHQILTPNTRFSHVGFEARRVKLKRILHKRFSKVLILFRNSSLTFAVIVVSLCALFLLGFLLLAYRVKARGQKQKFQVILSSLNIFDEVIT